MAQLADLLGESPAIAALREQVRRLLHHEAPARRQPPVLIRGETGTGKGLLAQAIHDASPRSRGPFIPINCAAIPGTLLEAELFGVEAGAFTDARQRKAGLFQTAHRGTLFLDEVGALAHDLQAKLLTAIEDRVVRRVGGVRGEAVDVWVLSATSADLEAAMAAEGFRPDLYHRLATISLWLPPAARARRGRSAARRRVPCARVWRLRAAAEDADAGCAGRDRGLSLARQCPGARQRDGARGAHDRRAGDRSGRPRAAGLTRTAGRGSAVTRRQPLQASRTRWTASSGRSSSRRWTSPAGTWSRPPSSSASPARRSGTA